MSRVSRLALALSLSLAVVGAGIGGREMVAEETAQAQAFVAQGERALSRDDRAAAVLSFERARWLAPRAPFVRAAMAAAGVKDVEPLLPRALRLVTAREWSALATAAGWVSALGIAFVLARWRRRHALWVALAAGSVAVIGMAGVVESTASSPAIVTTADAPLLIAPYASAASERALPAGTMVLVGGGYGTFVHIQDADGQAGWVQRESIEPIADPRG